MKYFLIQEYRHKNGKTQAFIQWYTTKNGFLRFHIQVYKDFNNNSGFCTCVHDYKTGNNDYINYLKWNENYYLFKEERRF